MEILNTLLSDFADNVCNSIFQKTQKLGVSGVGITGSYARGDYSKSRPDINFALFTTESTPDLLVEIGTILSDLNASYSNKVNLRPEYHPERFVYPWGRDSTKPDLFFKIAIFQLKDKDLPMPFGRPGFVLEGHKHSMSLRHGKNYFEDIIINSDNEQVLKGVNYTLPHWLKETKLTPLTYDLTKDIDLFFNESLVWGKLAIQQYAWIQGIKNNLDYSKEYDRTSIFEKIHNKEELRSFFDVPAKEKEMISLVLDARLKYSEWKLDSEMAKSLYFASCHLLDYFIKQSQELSLK